jgi:phosphorylated CTD-interacting factor 1
MKILIKKRKHDVELDNKRTQPSKPASTQVAKSKTDGNESTVTGGNESTVTDGNEPTMTGANDSTVPPVWGRLDDGSFGYRATPAKEKPKKSKKPKMKHALHKHTAVAATGIGSAAAQGHKLLTGKGAKIWDSQVRSEFSKRGDSHVIVSPTVEEFRYTCATKLREKLNSLVGTYNDGLGPPQMSWERWQSSSKLAELVACRKRKGGKLIDHILPEDGNIVDEGLVEDLIRIFIPESMARNMAVEMAKASAETVTEVVALQRRVKKKSKNKHAKPPVPVCVVEHKHSFDVMLGEKAKRLLKLNTQHYAKLRELFARHNSTTGKAKEGAGEAGEVVSTTPDGAEEEGGARVIDEAKFHSCLFTMLSRYNALLGHGMQAALSEHGFSVLKEALGVTFECFASPLNCHYECYCSAFVDTDAPFGSMGSFFDFHPLTGSFEANPPFIKPVIASMVRHIEGLFAAPEAGPLSFVVIVPGDATSHAPSTHTRLLTLLAPLLVPVCVCSFSSPGWCSRLARDGGVGAARRLCV